MRKTTLRHGFTLVELLVVIGIIAILTSLLLPTVTRAQSQAKMIVCKKNMQQVGISLSLYGNDYNGYPFPVGPYNEATDQFETLGTNVPREERWTTAVFDVWNPDIMKCPADEMADKGEEHSYVLNKHLAHNRKKLVKNTMSEVPDGRNIIEVVLMGEKKSDVDDYYMEINDFDRVVEQYRHGPVNGSNYMYASDYHVKLFPPETVKNALDPWDVPDPDVPDPEAPDADD